MRLRKREGPPRAFEALLRWILPASDRDAMPRELDDLFRERLRARGPGAARWWYRRQVGHFVARLTLDRLRTWIRAVVDHSGNGERLTVDSLVRDLRLAGRVLLRRPGFTLVAVLSLTLGIGANTAMFSLVNAVLLRKPPVESPETLVDVYTSDSDGLVEHATFSWLDFVDLRAADEVFTDALGYELFLGVTETRDGPPELLTGELVSANYFEMLGVRPVAGRGFRPAEDRDPGGHAVAVLGYGYWQTKLGGDPDVVGRTVRLNQRAYTVVGVAPEDFHGLFPALVPEVWVPMAMADELKGSGVSRLERRSSRSLFVKARLAPGVEVEGARAWLDAFAQRLAEAHPETNEGRRMTLVPSGDVSVHPDVDRALVPVAGLLLAVVGLVLVIACANLASFLLARAEDGRKDFAVRLALGAGRGALIRQLLVETMVLALAGAAGGVLVARATLELLLRFQPPVPIPLNLDLSIDGTVLVFTVGVAVVAGLAFGLLPALQATRPDVTPALKEGGERASERRGLRLRDGLVAGQVALSVVLLVGAGLFLRSLQQVRSVDPGFDTGPGAILWPNLQLTGLTEEEGRATWIELQERLLAHPVIDRVALADVLPLGLGVQTTGVTVPGVESASPDGRHAIDFGWVSPGYFELFDIPLVRGRSFVASDGEDAPPVAIVSEAFAQRFWPGEQIVGRTLDIGGAEDTRIVGVAADTKVRTLGEEPRPRIYRPTGQQYLNALQVVVRGAGRSSPELLAAARQAAREVDPDLVFFETKTMEEHLAIMLFAPRMAALLLGVFGALALFLAAVGIYGVVSYAVARRTREVGIRISLGATPGAVVRLVVGGGMRLVGIGAVLGLVLAGGSGLLVARFLIGVEPWDLPTLLAIPMVLGAVALLAAWVPARRVTSVDPVRALRTD